MVVVVVIIFVIYFFTRSTPVVVQNQQPVTKVEVNTNTQNINVSLAKNYDVSIANFAFSPKTITLNKGDTVTWINNDSAPHKAVGDTLNSLSSETMSKGQKYTFTFNDTGDFAYHCSIHPSMKGNIIVK